jgi:hypothetical protein
MPLLATSGDLFEVSIRVAARDSSSRPETEYIPHVWRDGSKAPVEMFTNTFVRPGMADEMGAPSRSSVRGTSIHSSRATANFVMRDGLIGDDMPEPQTTKAKKAQTKREAIEAMSKLFR